jgi:hypothetical protein
MQRAGAVLADRWLQKLAQLVRRHLGVAQDPGQGPSFELTVQGHDQWRRVVGVAEEDVAPTLAHCCPAELAQGGDQLRARDDR